MKACYLALMITLLAVGQPTCHCQEAVNYNDSLVCDNQCTTKNDVQEIATALKFDISETFQQILQLQSDRHPGNHVIQEKDSLSKKDGTKCSTSERVLEDIFESLKNLSRELQSIKQDIYKGGSENPALSCQELYTFSKPSDYYWLKSDPASPAVRVYCDMERVCGCDAGSRGWMKVADIDMTKQLQCPKGFQLINRTTRPYRTCGRINGLHGCTSVSFSVRGLSYSRVCGRVVGYQVGSPNAFNGGSRGMESHYVEGISLTHGQPRKHIWTFAAALNEGYLYADSVCPCSNSRHRSIVPYFVGNDYFCDSGIRGNSRYVRGQFYPDDPLWDGEGCGRSSTCCQFNNPPWFCKQLPQLTTDNIELRTCHGSTNAFEDSPIEIVELFVN